MNWSTIHTDEICLEHKMVDNRLHRDSTIDKSYTEMVHVDWWYPPGNTLTGVAAGHILLQTWRPSQADPLLVQLTGCLLFHDTCSTYWWQQKGRVGEWNSFMWSQLLIYFHQNKKHIVVLVLGGIHVHDSFRVLPHNFSNYMSRYTKKVWVTLWDQVRFPGTANVRFFANVEYDQIPSMRKY